MQKISIDSTISEWVLACPYLAPVLYLAGVRGDFEGKTVRQVCKDKAINEDYLLNLLKAFTDDKYVPAEALPSYSVLQLSELLSTRYPFFLGQFNTLSKEILRNLKKESVRNENVLLYKSLNQLFTLYLTLLSERAEQQKQKVVPHIAMVYELYYSPDYTSERSDILNYSLEFYDGKSKEMQESFSAVRKLLDELLDKQRTNLKFATDVFALYQLNQDIKIQQRVEQQLLRPLVLQMEESIIKTFQKKNKTFRRSNYLPLPQGMQTPELLSQREKEVLQLLAQGMMNKEIADQLHIGLTTVISHRKNIVGKLGIRTVPGLTVYAYTQGYLDESVLTNED